MSQKIAPRDQESAIKVAMEVRQIRQKDDQFPDQLTQRMGGAAPVTIYACGNLDILQHPRIGLICSIQCPGSIVIKTFDIIRRLKDAQVVMIGGFHSPMERECLDLLLRGTQPVIFCPARSLHNLRMGEAARKALSERRLLILSVFGDEVRRTTLPQAVFRNDFVAAMSEAILVPHATKSGKTWATVCRAIESNQKVFTFEDEENSNLIEHGAIGYQNSQLDFLIQKIEQFRHDFI